MIRRRSGLLVLATGSTLAISTAGPALAVSCSGVDFPDSVPANGAELVLNGLGIRKATLLEVEVYVAGLYLPQVSSDADAILGAGQPWQLVLQFVRDVGADDMKEAFEEGFENAGADVATLQPKIDQLTNMFVDFEEGQAVSFASDPGTGVEVAVDGTATGTIEGADFASALLEIWLGPEPPNEDLKSGLLGGPCE